MFELMKEVIAGARKIKEADRVDLIELFGDALFAVTQAELESCLKAIKTVLVDQRSDGPEK